MFNIVQTFNSADVRVFFLCLCVCFLLFKVCLIIALLRSSLKIPLSKWQLGLIGLFLFGLSVCDISWIVILIRRIFEIKELASITGLITRWAWGFHVIQYLALGFFIRYLMDKKHQLVLVDRIFLFIAGIISAYFFLGAFIGYGLPILFLEYFMIDVASLYLIVFFMWSYYITKKRQSYKSIPSILQRQCKVFLYYFIIPHLCWEFVNLRNMFLFSFFQVNIYVLESCMTTLSMLMLFYCWRQVMSLRFLNLRSHVESKEKFDFVTDFNDILEQLSYVTSLKELSQLTQTFFERAFAIPFGRIKLFLRQDREPQDAQACSYFIFGDTHDKVERFLTYHKDGVDSILSTLHTSKVFIKDEIEFTNFYEQSKQRDEIIAFLKTINADIFLPIYERNAISAYIIVESKAHPDKLYTSKDRDEMLVFTSYLSNVINLLKYNNLSALQQNEKELQEERYRKHQEINHYKESIRSFLRSHKERKIGIIFYKSRRFSYANEAAQELIGADINMQQGHPLALALKTLARKVQEYKSAHTSFTSDNHGNKLVATGIPSLEQNSVIIMLYYPEVSDIMRAQFELLKDPSKWDYILYLETTGSGQLINQLIPGSGEKLLNFKIALLEVSLSKKATLLDMAADDIMPTVELLHHISMRQQLHTLKLSTQERNHEVAIKLFGLNPLLGSHEEGLLSKLDNGTLFIENIHYLSMETQQALADFILYGYFNKHRSDHKMFSNARIICSSPKNLATLAAEGHFSKALYNELKKASLIMPSLTLLPDVEVAELAEGFSHQALKTETFKNLIQLNDKDKDKLLDQRPVSLQELKSKVHQVLVAKSSKHKLHETTEFDPAYHVTDPELVHAVRLGKKALKDPHIMALLWNKFRNQNKIALLLGVNRSSVNRRCHEYNLYTIDDDSDKIH